MAGCCGAKQASVDYEVTFKDGSKATVSSMPEARILLSKDQTTGRPYGTMKAVPKAKTL